MLSAYKLLIAVAGFPLVDSLWEQAHEHVCSCVLLGKAVSHWERPPFKASHNYMVAYAGVGTKLAEQPVITEGEECACAMGTQFHCPRASLLIAVILFLYFM